MARAPRIERPAGWYHVPARGNERKAILRSDRKWIMKRCDPKPQSDLTDEQILEYLLALNLERAAEEEKAGKVKKQKTSREQREDEII